MKKTTQWILVSGLLAPSGGMGQAEGICHDGWIGRNKNEVQRWFIEGTLHAWVADVLVGMSSADDGIRQRVSFRIR